MPLHGAHLIVMTGPMGDSAPMFWTGTSWSSEVTYAARFVSLGTANLPEREFLRKDRGLLVRVMRDWGTSEERAVDTLLDTRTPPPTRIEDPVCCGECIDELPVYSEMMCEYKECTKYPLDGDTLCEEHIPVEARR